MDTVTKERLPPKTDLSQWDLRELLDALAARVQLYATIADHRKGEAYVSSYLMMQVPKIPERAELLRRDPEAQIEVVVFDTETDGYHDVLLTIEARPDLQPTAKATFLIDFETL